MGGKTILRRKKMRPPERKKTDLPHILAWIEIFTEELQKRAKEFVKDKDYKDKQVKNQQK